MAKVTTGFSAPMRTRERWMPDWVWSFIGACALIPMISLGGVWPVGIGLFGVVGCGAIAQDPTQPKTTRILLCTGLTSVCWTLFVSLVVTVFQATTQP